MRNNLSPNQVCPRVVCVHVYVYVFGCVPFPCGQLPMSHINVFPVCHPYCFSSHETRFPYAAFCVEVVGIGVVTNCLHSFLLKWQIVCLVFIAMFSLFQSHVLLSLLLKCVHKKYDLYFTLKTSLKPQENVNNSLNLILLQDENIYWFIYKTPTVGV